MLLAFNKYMPTARTTYLGNLTTAPATTVKSPINFDAINFSSNGATAASPAKKQFIQNVAAKTAPAVTPPTVNPNAAFQNGVSGPAGTTAAPTIPGSGAAQPTAPTYDYVGGKAVPSGTNPPATPGDPESATAQDYDEQSAYSTYLKSLTAPTDTTAANKYLNDLITNQEQDLNAVDAHPGETTSFAGSEKERINASANTAIDAASRALSALQSRDTSAQSVAKEQLDYTTAKAKDATQAAKDAAAAAVAKQNALPASAAEYEYAKTQGYTGTYEQYQNEDANRKAKAAGSSTTATNAQQADDVASAILDFQNQMTQKGWAGANPEAYSYYRDQLTQLYGASAALALDAAMRTAGIVVDNKNK